MISKDCWLSFQSESSLLMLLSYKLEGLLSNMGKYVKGRCHDM